MNLLDIQTDIWTNIILNLKIEDLCNLLLITKNINTIINGKILLWYTHMSRQKHINHNHINNFMISIIIKSTSPTTINYKNYTPTIVDIKLLLSYILNCDVNKTLFMLKLIGNTNISYDHYYVYKNFKNEQKKLHYCFNSVYNDMFPQKSVSLNLHMLYLIFFTPINFMKQMLPYLTINESLCEFKTSNVYSYENLFGISNDAIEKEFMDNVNLVHPLYYLNDGIERINFLMLTYPQHNNFSFKNQLTFNNLMDENYSVPYLHTKYNSLCGFYDGRVNNYGNLDTKIGVTEYTDF